MSRYQRGSSDSSWEAIESMSGVIKSIEEQASILQDIRDELIKQTHEIGRGFEHLTGTLEWVEREIRTLKSATLSIERAKAEAIIDTKNEQYKSAKRIWSTARDRFSSQYQKVITDFVKGLEDNVNRFARLVSDELAPMFKINEGSRDFERIIEEMRPKAIDTLRTETAVNMSGVKGSELLEKYQSARESLTRFYNERKALADRIEAAKSEIESDLSQQVEPGEMALFRIPFYVVTLEDADGNNVKKIIGPSAATTRAEHCDEPIPELLESLAPNLEKMVAASPAFDEENIIERTQPIEGISGEAKSLVNKAAHHLEELGMSRDLTRKIQQFYGPDYKDWQPDSNYSEGDDSI